MKHKFACAGLLFLAALFLVTGEAAAQQPVKVRLGLPVDSFDFLPIYIAQERGFFTEEKVDAEVTVLRGGGGLIQALVAGEIDLGMAGVMELSLLRDKGVDVRLVMTTMDVPAFSVVARRELNWKRMADLKGGSLGVTSPGSLTYALATYFVTQAGLTPQRDVTLLFLGGGGEMIGALKAKKADALMLFEPFVTILVNEGSANVILDVPRELKAFPINNLVAKKSLIDGNPDLVRRSAAVLRKALRFIQTEPATARVIAQKKFSGVKPEILEAALGRYFPHYSKDGSITPDAITYTQEVLKVSGLISKAIPYQDLVTPVR